MDGMIRIDVRKQLINSAFSAWFSQKGRPIPRDGSACLSIDDALELIEMIDGEAIRLLQHYRDLDTELALMAVAARSPEPKEYSGRAFSD